MGHARRLYAARLWGDLLADFAAQHDACRLGRTGFDCFVRLCLGAAPPGLRAAADDRGNRAVGRSDVSAPSRSLGGAGGSGERGTKAAWPRLARYGVWP